MNFGQIFFKKMRPKILEKCAQFAPKKCTKKCAQTEKFRPIWPHCLLDKVQLLFVILIGLYVHSHWAQISSTFLIFDHCASTINPTFDF
jgi:hypothetical protein